MPKLKVKTIKPIPLPSLITAKEAFEDFVRSSESMKSVPAQKMPFMRMVFQSGFFYGYTNQEPYGK